MAEMPGAGMAPPGASPAPAAPGATGPATVPPQSAGLAMRGRIRMSLALKLMASALGDLGVTSKEGAEVAAVLGKLGKTFGDASADLTQQEAKLAAANASPVQQPTPQQGQAFAQMIKARQGQMGIGGGAPPPMAA